jgi:hypothetical protein
MAASDALAFPIKNKAFRVTFPIFDADGDLVTGATTPDSEISKDGGTFVDCTNEATEIATASGMYFLDLTATEMNADCVVIVVKTATAGAKSTPIVLHPLSIVEPTTVPGFGTGATTPVGIEEVLAWLLALARNKITQTATTTTLRNDADAGNIGTSTVDDDGVTFTRGEWA